MALSDADGIVFEANQAYLELYGYTAEEVIGQHFSIIFPPDRRTAARQHYQQVFDAQPVHDVYDSSIQRKDGSGRTVQSRVSYVVVDGTRTAMLSIIRDVTAERKQAAYQQLLIDAGHILSVSYDFQSFLMDIARLTVPRIADWCAIDLVDDQQQIQRVAAAHVDPAKVQQVYDFQRLYPSSLSAQTGFAKVIRTGESDYYPAFTDQFFVNLIGSNPGYLQFIREFDFASSLIVPLTANKRTIGAITLVTLHSSSRFLTAEDKFFAEELGRMVALAIDNARLQNDLQRHTDELKRSNEELERFAYVASHDLQEPLRMVTSYLKLVDQRYGETLANEAREFMTFAVDGAARMGALISDLLAYSRIRKEDHRFAPFSVQEALGRAVTNLSLQIADTRTEIITGELPVITGDENQFVQLFQNLISNAIKFCGSASCVIEITARREGEGWLFAVRDNGIGIKGGDLERIFVMFQRAHSRSDYPGTGIGLAICKKIIEYHHGRIWAESTVGEGTTFFFTVPAEG